MRKGEIITYLDGKRYEVDEVHVGNVIDGHQEIHVRLMPLDEQVEIVIATIRDGKS